MNRYSDFSVEDLVWDDFFRQWIFSPTSETNALWNNWISENPEMLGKMEQARRILLSMRLEEPEITDAEINEVVRRTVGLVNVANTATTQLSHRKTPVLFTTWMRLAACIALIILLGWTTYSVLVRKQQEPQLGQQLKASSYFVEETNSTSRTRQLVLSDGSSISLAPQGRVRYRKPFHGQRREVYLTGEAFFQIAKDPDRPFLVFANGLITKVLGTSFRIKAYEGVDQVTVEVKSGKVAVFTERDPQSKKKVEDNALQGVILKPNQKIIYALNEVKMVKTLVEKPEIVVPKSQISRLDFEDTPASEVFNTLGKTYGIDIIYDAALLKDCPLTAVLEGLTLQDKLNIICKAVESSYEIVDGQVIIHSKGCKN
ncbi:FecR family protein [Dyadobacter sediminis]|uniref:FecR family protein n=1 Tax=Dyadobacter sediminis TaxID=1493691 RepID=A0A5R9KK53_9BACT|nr:FecR family protein [Dyadobacter sediminis]TLU96575.1 FecR family protein [Dyadobacter sediminis]GGB83371.1 hypothetical protein GCM10011325_08650 [Dyadobacter sediminis]